MTFWHVVTKFFDSGKVKVNLAPIEADCKPENHMSENKACEDKTECGQRRPAHELQAVSALRKVTS